MKASTTLSPHTVHRDSQLIHSSQSPDGEDPYDPTKIQIDYEALPENSPVFAQLVAGAFAGIMEHTVMYPVDAVKTRMQTAQLKSDEGLIQAFSRISSSEGVSGLWRGVSSVIVGAGPAHAVYYLVFESTKTALCQHLHGNTRNIHMQNTIVTDEKHPLIASVSGIAATTTSDALMTPFDVVKQRMQITNTAAAPCARHVTSFEIASRMYRKQGIRPFYVSYPTTLVMNIPFAAINFGVYEYTSSVLNPGQIYNPLLHCVSGGLSGAAAAAITTPLDCIKTALQTQSIPNATGFFSAMKGLYRKEGLKTFFRGVKPRVVFNVPSTAISWTAYEMAKAYLLPTRHC
ncbi:DEKNAAC101716 [Brettanomyces naardenensis]|uniref:DEKNAAC101716 n=1 Tax=Brettanomyces naardenensis TaxID=13370 RepID=A0A448YIK6_BRENA|nr:DEKNAAC101716 [Brettanomyces naardenensis]